MSGRAYVPPHRRVGGGSGAGAVDSDGGDSRRFPSSSSSSSGGRRRSSQQQRSPELSSSNRWENTSESDPEVERLLNAFSAVYCINLKHRTDRWNQFRNRLQRSLGKRGQAFIDKVVRFDAVNGAEILESDSHNPDIPPREWDASKNALYDHHIQPPFAKTLSPGEVGCSMSHMALWRKLLDMEDDSSSILVLEDDVSFYHPQHNSPRQSKNNNNNHHHQGRHYPNTRDPSNNASPPDFYNVFAQAMDRVPNNWDILYLGFSDRGERIEVPNLPPPGIPEVNIFRPQYGFHTHAYAIRQSATKVLLSNLPVRGPLDVWLADNEWFGLKVYCCVVANEGWRGTGAYLITQNRKGGKDSNISQSGRSAAG